MRYRLGEQGGQGQQMPSQSSLDQKSQSYFWEGIRRDRNHTLSVRLDRHTSRCQALTAIPDLRALLLPPPPPQKAVPSGGFISDQGQERASTRGKGSLAGTSELNYRNAAGRVPTKFLGKTEYQIISSNWPLPAVW